MNQLGGLAEDYSKYQEKEVQVIALAVQPQEEAVLTVERTEADRPGVVLHGRATIIRHGIHADGNHEWMMAQ